MKKTPSLTINFIMNACLTASSILFPLITFPYVSRILLPEGTGRVAFAASIVSYFSITASLGIPTYGIRACAQVRDNRQELTKTFQEIFLINAAMTILTYVFFLLAVFLIPQLHQEKWLFLICGSTIFFNLIGVEWLYKALEQYPYITLRSVLFKLISLFLMFLLIHSREDYIIYGGITVLAGVGSGIFNFIHAAHFVSFAPCRHCQLKPHIKPILILFVFTVATTIYTNLDIAMLGFLTNDREVGYYNAAIKVKSLLATFVTSLGAVLLPRISYYVEQNRKKEFYELMKKALDFVFFAAVPLCVYFTVMAKECILFLTNPAFLPAVFSMQIIMPTVLFIGLTNVIGIQFLIPLGKEHLVVYSTCAGAAADLLLNAILIPRYASAGAAIGTLAAEFIVLLLQLWFIRKKLSSLFGPLQVHKVAAALIPSAISLYFLRNLPYPGSFSALLVTASIYFAIYISALFLLRYQAK